MPKLEVPGCVGYNCLGTSRIGPIALDAVLGTGEVVGIGIGAGDDTTYGPIGDAVDAAAVRSISSKCLKDGPGDAPMA